MRERYYGRQKFEIKVTSDSLEAQCNLPFGPKRNRVLTSLLLLGLAVCGMYQTWLSGDSLRYSNWGRLTHHYSVLHPGSIVFASSFYAVFLLMGIRLLCPAGAILSCDRNQVATTRIPWYSFTGRWVTRSYNVLDESGFHLKLFSSDEGAFTGSGFS
jgi:hypothetical protein